MMLGVRVFAVSAWIIFAAAAFSLDYSYAKQFHFIVNTIGALGLVISLGWVVLGRWWGPACVTVSLILVAVYVVRWLLRIDSIHDLEPGLGWGVAAGRLVHTSNAVFQANLKDYGFVLAVLALYWDILVVPVQIAVSLVLLSKLKRSSGAPIAA